MQIKKVLYWVTIGFLIFIMVACVGLLCFKWINDAMNEKMTQEQSSLKESYLAMKETMDSQITRPSIPEEPTVPTEPDPTQPTTEAPELNDTMIFEYQALYELNNDMVGWLQIPGTIIDYPVVQSPYQANFYLRRNFYKEYATCGTIYAREKCDINKPSDNITLYGHNMGNGTMFADLHKYKDKTFWENNKYVHFDTLTEYHTYEIFAVFNTTADLTKGFSYHVFDDAADAAEYNKFVSTCKILSFYDTGITPQFSEKLITLSTCDKSIEEGRLVVVARRVV